MTELKRENLTDLTPRVIIINIPHQTQLVLDCPEGLKQARMLVLDGINGRIETAQGSRLIFIHTTPGTIYAIMPKPEFDRMVSQMRFAAPGVGMPQGH